MEYQQSSTGAVMMNESEKKERKRRGDEVADFALDIMEEATQKFYLLELGINTQRLILGAMMGEAMYVKDGILKFRNVQTEAEYADAEDEDEGKGMGEDEECESCTNSACPSKGSDQ